ncbi:MAG: 50S ribosomal protein L29 [Alphaproteobacteria bacterium]|nr:50S ribosomal protein L29 [Alphaproteobacteria bacterium]
MSNTDKKSALASIAGLKKELLMFRVKASSGEAVSVKDYKGKKKEIARLFTKLNAQKA